MFSRRLEPVLSEQHKNDRLKCLLEKGFLKRHGQVFSKELKDTVQVNEEMVLCLQKKSEVLSF